jgi:hypothetical protein
LPQAPPAETFKQLFDLLSLVANSSACEGRLANLRRQHAKVRTAVKRLDEAQQAFEAYAAKERADIAAERDSATKRLVRAQDQERAIEERQKRVFEAEQQWANLKLPGQPAEMFGTITRSSDKAFTGLQRARYFAEHGELPRHPDAPPEETRRDNTGESFPAHTTITRSPEQPEAVRVRVGRKSPAPPPAGSA